MATQQDFAQFYSGQKNPDVVQDPQGECDDIEVKWDAKRQLKKN
jgi:hypothetical protein